MARQTGAENQLPATFYAIICNFWYPWFSNASYRFTISLSDPGKS